MNGINKTIFTLAALFLAVGGGLSDYGLAGSYSSLSNRIPSSNLATFSGSSGSITRIAILRGILLSKLAYSIL
jgi:hypothetical protein